MSADLSKIDEFKSGLRQYMLSNNMCMAQVYNADETGIYWKALPNKTQAIRTQKNISGHKVSKERLSALVGSNMDGTHKLKLTVVGKSKKPRPLKDCMHKLPVKYFANKKAWFTQSIFSDWFIDTFIPSVEEFQIKHLNIKKDDVKALLLLDNAPAQPSSDLMKSPNGKICCMFLPPNTTSVIQPMDQGVIVSMKRIYRRKQLNDCLVFFGEGDLGLATMKNIKDYNIKKAIYNMAEAY